MRRCASAFHIRPLLCLPMAIARPQNVSNNTEVQRCSFRYSSIRTSFHQTSAILASLPTDGKPSDSNGLEDLEEEDVDTTDLLQNASSAFKSGGMASDAVDDEDSAEGLVEVDLPSTIAPVAKNTETEDANPDAAYDNLEEVTDDEPSTIAESSSSSASSVLTSSIHIAGVDAEEDPQAANPASPEEQLFGNLSKLVTDAEASLDAAPQPSQVSDDDLEGLLDDISYILPHSTNSNRAPIAAAEQEDSPDNTLELDESLPASGSQHFIIDDDDGEVVEKLPPVPAMHTTLSDDILGLSPESAATPTSAQLRRKNPELDPLFTLRNFRVNPRPLCRGIVVAWYPAGGYGYIADSEDLSAQEEFIYQSTALKNLKMAIASGGGFEEMADPLKDMFKVYKVSGDNVRFTNKAELPAPNQTLHVFREVEFDKKGSSKAAVGKEKTKDDFIFASNVCDVGGFTMPPGPESPVSDDGEDIGTASVTSSPSASFVNEAAKQGKATPFLHSGSSAKTPNSAFREDFYTLPRDHNEDGVRMVSKDADVEDIPPPEPIGYRRPFINKMSSMLSPVSYGHGSRATSSPTGAFVDPVALTDTKHSRSMTSSGADKRKAGKAKAAEEKKKIRKAFPMKKSSRFSKVF